MLWTFIAILSWTCLLTSSLATAFAGVSSNDIFSESALMSTSQNGRIAARLDSLPTQITTSTVYTTSSSTVISCASTIEAYPSHSTTYFTLTISVVTTICPFTQTSIVSQTNSEIGLAMQSIATMSSSIRGSSFNSTYPIKSTTIRALSDQSEGTSLYTSATVKIRVTTYYNTSTAMFTSSATRNPLTPALAQSSSSITIMLRASTSTSPTSLPPALSSETIALPLKAPSTTTSTSAPECTISGHCDTYKLLSCPGGDCFCGQDINNNPTCFLNEKCVDTKPCSSDADCASNEACGVKDCCSSDGGRCIRRMIGCLDSPVSKSKPYWVPKVAPCVRRRTINATDEDIDFISLIHEKRLAC